MLMFRSRRNALIKRLWKARLPGGSDEEGREVRKWLLRRIAEDQLETLVIAIETRGAGRANDSDCVLIDRLLEECPHSASTSPQLLCCQLWRWPDLDTTKQLKKLPMCKSTIGITCCNPYHWSRLYQPETPPPPYSRFTSERLKPEDRAPSESSQLELRGSLSTNGEDSESSEASSDMDVVRFEEVEDFDFMIGQLKDFIDTSSGTSEEEENCEAQYLHVRNDQKQMNKEAGQNFQRKNLSQTEFEFINMNNKTEKIKTDISIKNETEIEANDTSYSIAQFNKYDINDTSTEQTITEEKIGNNQWCKLAYWELSTRVGRQYPVENQSVNVFWSTPHGDGLCLATLAMHSFSPPSIVQRARKKIGEGITLSREEDGVWAYNRSDCPMFVNSPALDDHESSLMIVYRVPPGHCLNIYSELARSRLPNGNSNTLSKPHIGPIDPNSVRISFAKGWGPKYSRREVTSCPTWLEVLLAPCR